MPEKLNPGHNDAATLFAIAAIAEADLTNKVVETKTDNGFEVQLLVNGVEIPFHATLQNWWTKCENELNRRAAEIAMEKFSELSKIGDFLEDLKFQIRDKVEDTFGVRLGEED